MTSKNQTHYQNNFKFLQDNIAEIEDPLLNMMPLLKNITKQNVIPIIDFEDITQTELNFLVTHVFDCLPSVSIQQTVTMQFPCDQSRCVKYMTLPDVAAVEIAHLKGYLKIDTKETSPFKKTDQFKAKDGDSDFQEEDFEADIETTFELK